MTTAHFHSERQKHLFDEVVAGLRGLGYRGDLLVPSYQFLDWFLPDNPERTTPAAAFWTTPQSYDSACFSVLISNGRSGTDLVSDFRALGAPFAFEVRDDCVIQWKVGLDSKRTRETLRISPDNVSRVFREHENEWARHHILRIKNIGLSQGPMQFDLLIDTALIPALESQIKQKLHRILADAITNAKGRRKRSSPIDDRALFRLVFRFLAAKVLHDRRVANFESFGVSDHQEILAEIQHYYGEPLGSVVADKSIQQAICHHLWTRLDLRNLSVETLAYIYENTLIDPQVRTAYGTYSTPHSVAKYVVHRLPLEQLSQDAPLIVDPFSGHGIFLVAALQRLREQLVATNMTPRERHDYFVSRLRGFDIDAFAVEVATLCLILADFPNRNGWKLTCDDVFTSKALPQALSNAGAVLSNPPFGPFTPAERKHYSELISVQKPVEFIHRVMTRLPMVGMLGMVLPRQVIDGDAYRDTRRALADRFDEIEVVSLPDRIFENSQVESAVIVAKAPKASSRSTTTVYFTEVADRDRANFLSAYGFTRRDCQLKGVEDAAASVAVPPLADIWSLLSTRKQLVDVADIHRGIEWQGPLRFHVSDTKLPGFKKGLQTTRGRFFSLQTPPTTYLDTRSEHRRKRARGAFDLPWHRPKVIVNAARVSRENWRIAACVDNSGLWCTQRFHAIWPTDAAWAPEVIAAVLNGPVANMFVAANEGMRDVTVATVKAIPLPALSPADASAIRTLVKQYMVAISFGVALSSTQLTFGSASGASDTRVLTDLLLKIDALVLRGYNLPPRLERKLLDSFKDARRPVPFQFPAYYPADYAPTVPLSTYLSREYQEATPTMFVEHVPAIRDPSLVEILQELE